MEPLFDTNIDINCCSFETNTEDCFRIALGKEKRGKSKVVTSFRWEKFSYFDLKEEEEKETSLDLK